MKKTANSGCFVPTPTPTPGGNSDPDNDGDSGGDNDNDGDGSGVAGSGNTGNCPPSTQVPPRPSSDCHQASTHEPGDPNDKLGPHGVGKAAFVSGRAPANYEVLFTNEATATAPAHEVVVTDQLDPHKYNLRTFSFLAFYFGNQQVVPPAGQKNFVTNVDLRPAQNMIVRINAALNLTTGAMLTRFDSLDPNTGLLIQDVSLGFLPPDVSPPQGEGGVVFGVSPASGLATGSTVSNSASIVFDAQPAISTPTWTNTVDSSSPTSQIMALPHQESCPNFLVDASASDVGAGLAPLNFYVSDNGGAFQPWLTTERRQNIYPGAPGHAYSFYAMATDLVGNLEPAKTGAEASTSVASTEICGPPVIRANRNSVQFGNDTLTGNLELINLGGSDGSNLVVNSVTFGNSSGGQVALTSPALPQNLGAIRSGRLVNVPFAANLAAPVNSATVTVSGTVQDSGGNTHNWSNNFVIQNGEMASAGS